MTRLSGWLILVWCLLVLTYWTRAVAAQGDELSPPVNCSLIGSGNFVSVTGDTLVTTENNLQAFVDCVSPNGSIIFDTPSVSPIGTITIDKPVRLETSDAVGKVAISCPPEGTVFDIRSHGVILSNFIFANCSVDGAAAVQAENCGSGPSRVDIDGAEFLSNSNRNGTAGVKISGCRITVRDSKFFDGFGSSGSAMDISNNSVVMIQDSSFGNNRALVRGGALHVRSSVIAAVSCNFTGNNASMDGGAISIEGGTNLTLIGCRLDSNGAGFRGGGLYAQSGTLSNISVIGTKFRKNFVDGSAANLTLAQRSLLPAAHTFNISSLPGGGGMAINGSGIRCTAGNGTEFDGNSVSGIGGGVSVDAVGDFSVNGAEFKGNEGWHGANVYLLSTVASFRDTTFLNSQGIFLVAENSRDDILGEGTAIWTANSNVSIDESRFNNNTAVLGSAILGASSNISLQNCEIEGSVDRWAGCITLLSTSRINATACTFSDNAATGAVGLDGLGGVITAPEGGKVIAKSCLFRNNSAYVGGAVLVERGQSGDNGVFENCTFLRNTAIFGGGAIAATKGAGFTVVDSTFDGNTAGLLGGAVDVEAPLSDVQAAVVQISGSTFRANRAGFRNEVDSLTGSGGAVFCGDLSQFNVQGDRLEGEQIQNVAAAKDAAGNLTCTLHATEFSANAAGLGGAISGVFANNLSVDFVDFVGNSANDGGALFLKMGGSRDPQPRRLPSTYVSGGNLSFVSNRALRGGAMFYVTDVSTADLVRGSISPDNVTRTRSDGLSGNEDDIFMMDSRFRRNVANDSGGAWYTERTRVGCRNCTFGGNRANSAGGAVCIRKQSALHVRNVTFAANNARVGGALSARNSFVDIVEAMVNNNAAEVEGGGLHISALDSIPFRFNLVSHVGNATVIANRAPVGAGMYFFVEEDLQETRDADAQNMAVTGSVFANNNAALAGAALFTNRPDLLGVCCACNLSKATFPPTRLFDALRRGVDNISKAPLVDVLTNPNPCPQKWTNNTLSRGRQSDVVGTLARSTELCTAGGACARDGAPLKIFNHVSGEELETIAVRLLDSFNNTAFGQPGVQVRVEPNGFGILTSGQLIASLGTITNLTSIRLQAEVGKTHFLKLSFNTSNLPSRDVEVDVRACIPGETPFRNETCSACESGRYSFSPDMLCARCPENAECQGSTVTPLDGFWHSTSKSTELHECINEKSCRTDRATIRQIDGRSRSDLLAERAKVAHSNGSLLEFSRNDEYPQCAPGHHGVLCGACDDTHGKVRSGSCIKCRGRARNVLFASLLACWVFVVVSVLARNVIAVVSDDIIALSDGGATQHWPATVKRESALPRESAVARVSGLPTEPPRQLSGSIAYWVQGASPPGVREGGSSKKRPDDSFVREILRNRNYSSDILKIIVNFLQVTGVAVFINAGWTRSVSRALGIADATTSGGQGLFAFECAFSSDSSIPRSTQMFIVSLLFPVMLQAVLMTLSGVFALATSNPLAYLLRRWRVSALVVFYFVYIDMARNMVIIFDCATVDEEDQPDGHAIARSRYWVRDTDTICREGGHLTLTLVLAIPVLVFVTFGFPFALVLIFSGSREKLETPAFLGTYGFLYWSYRPGSRYWEAVIMLRKACLAAISVFGFSLRPNLQATLAVGVLMIASFAHLWVQPFVTLGPNLHRMEAVSLSCSIFAYLTALVFNDPNTSDGGRTTVSVVFIVFVLGVLLYLLVELVWEAWKAVEVILRKAQIEVGKDMSVLTKVRLLLTVLWMKLTCHSSEGDTDSQAASTNGLPT